MTSKAHISSPEASRASAECLTLEQLIAYTEGKIPFTTRMKLEFHLKKCELCADAVDGMASFADTGKVTRVLQDLKIDFDTQTRRIQRRNRWGKIIGGVGLLLCFIVIAAVIFRATQPDLAGRFLAPYPNTIPVVRSSISENLLMQAIEAYTEADYARAARIFGEYLKNKPENVTANFYAGVAFLMNGQPGKAIQHLTKVHQNCQKPFAEPAVWYLGLAHLKMKNFMAARKIFEQIRAGNGEYQSKCEAILRELPPVAQR
jgi:tetratricopeptide (TPR) repeat protein